MRWPPSIARDPWTRCQVDPDHESSDHAWVCRADVPDWLPRMAFRSMAAALDDWAQERAGVLQDR